MLRLDRHAAAALIACSCAACGSEVLELAGGSVPASDDEPPVPWISEDCLGGATEEELTLGILYEEQQDLAFDVAGGSNIAVWPSPEEQATGKVELSPGYDAHEHIEGEQALCARVTGNGGFWIDLLLERVDALESRVPVDFSTFDGGYLEFEASFGTEALRAKVEWSSGSDDVSSSEVAVLDHVTDESRFGGDWNTVRVPLCHFEGSDWTRILSPLGLFPEPSPLRQSGDPVTFCVDAIRLIQAGACPDSCER